MQGQVVIEQHIQNDPAYTPVPGTEQCTQTNILRMAVRKDIYAAMATNSVAHPRMEILSLQRAFDQISRKIANNAVRVRLREKRVGKIVQGSAVPHRSCR